jgi:hypothetical protein
VVLPWERRARGTAAGEKLVFSMEFLHTGNVLPCTLLGRRVAAPPFGKIRQMHPRSTLPPGQDARLEDQLLQYNQLPLPMPSGLVPGTEKVTVLVSPTVACNSRNLLEDFCAYSGTFYNFFF